jgi:tRNA/tmRNA/rRNA uracil-C5-methylase (TrmA/RlmC/RlmD family)
MLRNQVFTDFNLNLKREIFNPEILSIYDIVINFIKKNSIYDLDFWKSIWIKCVNDQNMLLLLVNPEMNYLEELNRLSEKIKVDSFYYQFRKDQRKPEKLENLYLLRGFPTIYEFIENYKFHLSPYSFCQANNIMAHKLYKKISNLIDNSKHKLDNLVIYGRTSSPLSILNSKNFKNIYCSIPCPVVYKNMLTDLKVNHINNVYSIYQNKKKFNPDNLVKNPYLLLLSPGYQGLPKEILNNLSKLKNVYKVFFLYCNKQKMEKDLNYLREKINFQVCNQCFLEYSSDCLEIIVEIDLCS